MTHPQGKIAKYRLDNILNIPKGTLISLGRDPAPTHKVRWEPTGVGKSLKLVPLPHYPHSFEKCYSWPKKAFEQCPQLACYLKSPYREIYSAVIEVAGPFSNEPDLQGEMSFNVWQREAQRWPHLWENPSLRTTNTTVDPQQPKENTMNATLTITTKTYINGVDITTINPSDIYGMISDQEAIIEHLSSIKRKPKMLTKELEQRQAGIEALVAYLDGLEK